MRLKVLKRNEIYEGRVFNVIVDDIEYPNGKHSIREVAEHAGGAVVLALFPDKRIILVRQHRYPFDAYITELPAGKLNYGEDPLHCAQRELAEETGYSAARWDKLIAIYTSPGFCSETLHIFLARDLTALPQGRALEEGEETMTMEFVSLDEAMNMIDRHEIVDAKSICGIMLTDRLLKKGGQT